jgi:hypothetical protein
MSGVVPGNGSGASGGNLGRISFNTDKSGVSSGI